MRASIVCAFNLSLIQAGMVMLVEYVAMRASVKSASFYVVSGVGRSIPAAGVLCFIGSLGLAGIPPTNGFISKMFLFSSGIDAAELGSLAFIGMGSILTLVYTMRAFQRIGWQEPSEGAKAKPGGDHLLAPAILIVLVLLLGLWAEPLVQVATDTSVWSGNPAGYIQAAMGGQRCIICY